MENTELEKFLSAQNIKFKKGERGAKLTTAAVGGEVPYLVEPASFQEAAELLKFLSEFKVKFRILGAGSNLLIPDAGVEGAVIRLGRNFRYFEPLNEAGLFKVGAAMSLMSLSRELSAAGFSGLEFAGGIPATVGGAVRMNAGAHGAEISQVLESVEILADGEIASLKAASLQFSYRQAGIPANSLILAATIRLAAGSPDEIETKRRKFLEYRKDTQPLTTPSFGSVFKNPAPDRSAGSLIEQAGLKGRSVGGAQISPMHANWIINSKKNARCSDIAALINICKQEVQKSFGVELCEEVVYW